MLGWGSAKEGVQFDKKEVLGKNLKSQGLGKRKHV